MANIAAINVRQKRPGPATLIGMLHRTYPLVLSEQYVAALKYLLNDVMPPLRRLSAVLQQLVSCTKDTKCNILELREALDSSDDDLNPDVVRDEMACNKLLLEYQMMTAGACSRLLQGHLAQPGAAAGGDSSSRPGASSARGSSGAGAGSGLITLRCFKDVVAGFRDTFRLAWAQMKLAQAEALADRPTGKSMSKAAAASGLQHLPGECILYDEDTLSNDEKVLQVMSGDGSVSGYAMELADTFVHQDLQACSALLAGSALWVSYSRPRQATGQARARHLLLLISVSSQWMTMAMNMALAQRGRTITLSFLVCEVWFSEVVLTCHA